MNIVKLRSAVVALCALGIACAPGDRSTPVSPAPGGLLADAQASDAPTWSAWSAPVNLGPVVNSTANDNHPAISRDGLSLYITSGRPGGVNGVNALQVEEIWVSRRTSLDAEWGPPVNLGPAVNSIGSNTGSPTFTPDGHHMYFHSTRSGGCGLADLDVARRHDKRDDFGWESVENLGCVVNGPAFDNGPTYFEDETTGITTLYFTSTRLGGPGDYDIYASTRVGDESEFGPAVLVAELSAPGRDTRTAIRRDGLEMFLSSDGTGRVGGIGSQDIWVSTRATTLDPWSTPVNLGPTVNSTAFDGAPALSFDGTTLYFFSERAGGFGKRDLYVTTRTRLSGDAAAAQGSPAGTWTLVAPMPTARLGLAATTGKHGIIYAIGGSTGLSGGTIVPTVEAYDQKAGTWSAAAPMPTARRYLMAATDQQGRVYAIGGALAGVFRNVVERYDPASDSWTTMASLPVALCCGGAATGRDGRIYVVGGFANGNVQLSAAEAYDPASDTWTSLAPLPAPRAGKLAAVAASDGRIYAVGGINGVTTVATVDAYDPCTDTWTPVGSMPTARRFLDAVLSRGGIIYALGGAIGSVGFPGTQELTTVEAYAPSAGTWTEAPPLLAARGALAAAVGRAGRIFAIGGFDGSSALSSVEVFAPRQRDVVDDESEDDGPATLCALNTPASSRSTRESSSRTLSGGGR